MKTKSKMQIRKAKRKDIPDLDVLREKSFQSMEFEEDKRYFINLLRSKNKFVFVATENEKVIGFIQGLLKKESGDIVNLYILKTFRGKGIGKKLMQKALGFIKGKNKKFVEVNTGYNNKLAQKFYSRFGFKPTQLWMEKKLR